MIVAACVVNRTRDKHPSSDGFYTEVQDNSESHKPDFHEFIKLNTRFFFCSLLNIYFLVSVSFGLIY